VLDLMIHDLDIVAELAGHEVSRVEAVGVSVLSKTEDIANARLRLVNGCVVNLTASRVSLERLRKVRLFQNDAYVSIDLGENKITIVRRQGEPAAPSRASSAGSSSRRPTRCSRRTARSRSRSVRVRRPRSRARTAIARSTSRCASRRRSSRSRSSPTRARLEGLPVDGRRVGRPARRGARRGAPQARRARVFGLGGARSGRRIRRSCRSRRSRRGAGGGGARAARARSLHAAASRTDRAAAPDLAIFVDSPDLNLPLASVAKRSDVPVLYYIAPQVWAWRSGRVRKLARRTDAVAVIFPFEEPLLRRPA
jgi:hypothetical protein